MNQTNVLVTGGAGFIGSHACKALARAGLRPITFDNLSTGNEDAVKWGPLINADIRNSNSLEQAIREHNIDIVLHFAASAYVGESVVNPEKYYENNVCGTHSLFAAMRKTGVSRIVFSSTCATYGIPNSVPISENTPQAPVNPYGFSKYVIERELIDFSRAYGFQSAILRYFNAAGCDEDGEIGENHDPETHLLPLAILAALGLGPELNIFGVDYDTPDGTAIRDYIHVTDLADAHVKAIQHLLAERDSIICNLGTGTGFSVREIIAAVQSATGRPVPTKTTARRQGDPPILVADPSRARSILSWSAKHSDLSHIVRTATSWIQRNY